MRGVCYRQAKYPFPKISRQIWICLLKFLHPPHFHQACTGICVILFVSIDPPIENYSFLINLSIKPSMHEVHASTHSILILIYARLNDRVVHSQTLAFRSPSGPLRSNHYSFLPDSLFLSFFPPDKYHLSFFPV